MSEPSASSPQVPDATTTLADGSAVIALAELPVWNRQPSVMVMDDSGSCRTVVEALDGKVALAKPEDSVKLSLIVCHANMPRMDGRTLPQTAKTVVAYKCTPVIMRSNESQDAEKSEGRAAGAMAWITKPFQPSRWVGAVNTLRA